MARKMARQRARMAQEAPGKGSQAREEAFLSEILEPTTVADIVAGTCLDGVVRVGTMT